MALDGLRGIAAFCVVLSHVAGMSWVPEVERTPPPHVWSYLLWHLGAPAVDVFFVLSGYVVARSVALRGTGYLPYLMGRFARLLPIAWTGVLAGLLLRAYVPPFPPGMTAYMHNLVEPLAQRDVVGLATMVWPVADASKVDPQLWTMFIEMQASILIPWAVLLSARSSKAYAAACALLVAGLILATGTLTPLCFVGFMAGAAYAVHEGSVPNLPRPMLALAAGIAVLLVRTWTGSDDEALRLAGAAGGLAAIVAIRQGAGRTALRHPVAQWLGRVSYPLYALHVPVMIGTCIWLAPSIGVTAAALVGILPALVASEIATLLVDLPAIRLSRLLTSSRP